MLSKLGKHNCTTKFDNGIGKRSAAPLFRVRVCQQQQLLIFVLNCCRLLLVRASVADTTDAKGVMSDAVDATTSEIDGAPGLLGASALVVAAFAFI